MHLCALRWVEVNTRVWTEALDKQAFIWSPIVNVLQSMCVGVHVGEKGGLEVSQELNNKTNCVMVQCFYIT